MVQQCFSGLQQWTFNGFLSTVVVPIQPSSTKKNMAVGNHHLVDNLPRKNVIAGLDSQWDFALRFGQ